MGSNLYSRLIIFSLFIIFLLSNSVSAQYCVDNLYNYGCLYGDEIDNISIGTINQTATGCGLNSYSDYTNLSSDFEQGSTGILQVSTAGYGDNVSMWIDFNDDQTFSTSEKLVSYLHCNSAYTTYTANFIVPVTAQLGDHRMRVRCVQYDFPFDACTQYYYGEVHDYMAHITPPVSMSFNSATTTQTITDNASLGSSDVAILTVQVVTSGSLNPVDATSFQLNSNGSTNYAADVTNTKIYYTGTDPNFAATNLFGSATNLSAPITGDQQLMPGVNYFWVVYDISSSGTIGDVIDAECTSVTVDGVAHTPTVTAPAGSRTLGYCIPTSVYGCYYAYIDGVQLNTLTNLFTYCNGNLNGYIEFAPAGNLTTDLELGTSYPISLSGSPYEYEGFGVWIDFNNDGDFDDADEFVYGSPFTSAGTQNGSISIPNNNSYIGAHKMRVRCNDYSLVNSTQSCTQFNYGETEDYTINITASTPMVYVSSTTTQNNTSTVQKSTSDNEILGIQIVTSGAQSPFDLTSLSLNANGSTNFSNDVSNVKVYYTGTSATFATTTLFGSSPTLPATISGSVQLNAGTNYFWVTYDVTSTAAIGDQLDAECTQIVMSGNGGTQVPSVTAPAGSRAIDYCIAVNIYGCYYGYIDGVAINTLDNEQSGCNGNSGSYIQYDPGYFTTSLEQGGSYPIFLTGPPNDFVGFGVWIDFNNDGDFNDAGEFAWSSANAGFGMQTGTINIPSTATLGTHRMRIRSKYYYILFNNESCGETYYNGETEDYTITITAPTDMSYVSSTTTQNDVSTVSAGQPDQDIIGIQIVTSGSLNPFSALSFKINSNGTTDPSDITNVKIYYTGNSPVFSTGTLFGSATDLSAPITGSQVLQGGINYFWVAYDISPTATLGDFLDAECEYITMDGGVGTKNPTVTAPAGNREINYCIGAYQYGCYSGYINGVTINTLVNTNTYCSGNANGYIEYPQSGNTTTQLELGQSYSLQLDGPSYYTPVGFGVWIDFNSNGGFDDPGEFVYGSTYAMSGSQYATVVLPCDDSFVGDHRMRVRTSYYGTVADSQACTTFSNGETEDYTITLSPPSTNQAYTSSVCTQNNLNNIGSGVANAEILGIQVSATGCLNPLTVTSLTLNSTGTTDFANDVTNVSVYYSGTDPNFSTATLFGSATDLSAPITGSQILNSGTNYFWVAYDISPDATFGDFVDAGCTQIDITGQGSVTPVNANPYGSRQINLCVPLIYSSCFYGDYINNVTFNTLSNLNSGCNGNANEYIYYAPAGNLTTNVQAGSTYTITLDAGYSPLGFGVWIDFNNNSDFGDPGEFVYASPSYGYSYTGSITIPIDPAFYGLRKMRIRGVNYATLTANDYCSNNFYGGETEDYSITIEAAPLCTGTPTAGTISADPVIVCGSGNVSLALSGYSAVDGLTFQWQQSPDGSTWSNISGATSTTYNTSLSTSTYYRVVVTCTNSGLFANSPATYMQVGGTEQITSTTNATICGEDSVGVSATTNASYVMWYDSPTAPAPVYYSSSPSTYTSFVNSTTTYYASAADGAINNVHVGPVSDDIGFPVTYYTYVGEIFNVYKSCVISGVYVYPASAGNVILQLIDQNYNQLAIDTLVVTAAQINQKTYVPLNFSVDIGNNYTLRQFGGVNLYSDDYVFPSYPFPYSIDGVISITQSSYGTNYYFSVYDWVIYYSTLCESSRTPVTITVTPSPEVTVTTNPANGTICAGSGQSVAITASGPYTSFTWSPADGLSSTSGASVTATPLATTEYIVKGSDGTCTNLDTVIVTVVTPATVTATASPDAVCAGGSSQLYASTPAVGYTVSSIPFSPDVNNGGTMVALQDNQVVNNLPIGFNFNFYGNNYTEFSLSSNGWISFDYQYYADCCQGQFIPDPNVPNNLIALAWEDLNPAAGGTVKYYTTGVSPNRKCVIEFDNVLHSYYYNAADPVTVQAILYESSNIIDIVTTSMPGNPSGYWAPHTEGIENASGTEAVTVPGRNADATWTATNDAWRFLPQQYSYTWSPSATLDNASIATPKATPSATTTYTVSVSDAAGCSSTSQVTVSLVTTPDAGTVTPGLTDFCGGGVAVLDLTGYSPGATIQWQESATSGGPYTDIPGATSSSYTTDSLNSTTYYVASVTCANGNVSGEATVQIDQAPNPPVGIDGITCGPGTVVLGATGSGGELNWFYSPNGGSYIGSGSPFTTPYINQTTTFYVQEGGPPQPPLTTNFFGSPYANGNMFDISAINEVFITGFDINMANNYNSDIEIYYKTGSYLGSEYQPQNWTLLGVAPGIQGLGSGLVTPVPLPLYLHVAAGQTIGIYITASNPSVYINSTYGSAIGNVYAQDNNLQVKEGSVFYYPFSYGYGPYQWNGSVHYVAPGCSGPLTPVTASITAPQVTAFASNPIVCEGDQVTLTAVSIGQQNFSYEWSPQIPGMQPQNGLNDTVTVTPMVTMTFTVSITDPNAPLCDTIITVPVTVDNTPSSVFIGNLASQYHNNDPQVTLVGVPVGGTFSGPGMNGNIFDPGSLTVGSYTITYTYTDANGCTGTTQQVVEIIPSVGIGNIQLDKDILLFPNPSEGLFSLSLTLTTAAKSVIITIYDQIGKQVLSQDHGQVADHLLSSFDFNNRGKGVYYVTINIDGEIFYRKLTIQ